MALIALRTLGLTLVGILLLSSGGATGLKASWLARGSPLSLETGALRLGIDASYPPFAASSPDNHLFGLEVDLAHELARRLQVELYLANTDLGGGIEALVANEFDGLLAGLARSSDLEDRAAFTRPYFDDGPLGLAVGQAPNNDLANKRVAVELGSAGDIAAARRLREGVRFSLVRQPDPASALADLTRGHVDVALLDVTGARLALARDPNLVAASEPFERRPLVLALRRANRGLLFAVDQTLEAMAEDGFLELLAKRWLGT